MNKRVFLKNALTTAVIALSIYIFFKYVLALILPFVIALGIAFIFNKPIKLLSSRTKLNTKVLSAIFVVIFIALFVFLVFLILNRLITEIEELLASLSANLDGYVNNFFAFLDGLSQKLPFLDAVGGDLSATVTDVIQSMITQLTAHIPGLIASVISMLPHILVFTVIIILALYYFCADFDNVKSRLVDLLPANAQKALFNFKARLMDTGINYLKACGILMVITYFELLVGFLMLGIPYSLTLSLLVAAVDMLPIFGVGTVLAPWAIWCQLTGDTYTAIGLLIIFAVVTVIRRFTEPKIISNGIGLSPITTLFAMYVGFKLFGLTGLFFSPLAAILILHALPENIALKLGFEQNTPKKISDEDYGKNN